MSRLNVQSAWVIHLDELMRENLSSVPGYLKPLIRRSCRDMTYAVGVGRHSDSEVADMVVKDIRMVSAILGKHVLYNVQQFLLFVYTPHRS